MYAISAAILGLWILLGVGLLGFVMRRDEDPVAPVLIAVFLGPLAETELRRALTVSEGGISILVSNSITITLYVMLALAVAFIGIKHMRELRNAKAEIEEQEQLTNA